MAVYPQLTVKMIPITASVTPIYDDNDASSFAATTVDAALGSVIHSDEIKSISSAFPAVQTAASLSSAITCPFIPTLTNFEPLCPSSFEDTEENIRCSSNFETNEDEYEDPEVLEAATILCMLSQARPSEEDVNVTMELLKPTFEPEQTDCYHEDDDMYEASTPNIRLRQPDRLAISEDVDEVNRLHQYVRSDLLEIFVVPQVEEEDDEPKETYERITRGSTYTGTVSTNRHYPGRVGFRCVHCANVRPSSLHTTKSCFYPLRLQNIYREVCAWQRIHFKNCAFVPRDVRERYDWLKSSDTSRGKVRYWEVSAKKIGLENNPDRFVLDFVFSRKFHLR